MGKRGFWDKVFDPFNTEDTQRESDRLDRRDSIRREYGEQGIRDLDNANDAATRRDDKESGQ